MTILFSRQAIDEIRDAESFYELQQKDLGKNFQTTVRGAIDRIADMPLLYPVISEPVRRAVLSKFPYAIFYLIDEARDAIIVIAVAHQHRKPFYT
jgi:plasmid stabilization system protein ParE